MKTIIIFLLLVIFGITLLPNNNDLYFEIANKSIKNYNPNREDYVIIIDYRKSILSERLYVLDMKTKKIIISSKVSHSFKSGILQKYRKRLKLNF